MQDKIAKRINALLALATNNPNEKERENAQREAQRLISRHQINQATLDQEKLNTEDPIQRKQIFDGGKARVVWKERVILTVANVNGCYPITVNGANPRDGLTYDVSGRLSAIKIVEILIDHILNQIEWLAANQTGLQGKAEYTSFKLGCAQKVCERLREGRLQAIQEYKKENNVLEGQTTTALVKFDNAIVEAKTFLDQTGVKLYSLKCRNPKVQTSAYEQGKDAGDKIDLNKPNPKLSGVVEI